jgi:hypothetical protein
MARLDAKWLDFSSRGQTWDHFWQDSAGTSQVSISGDITEGSDSAAGSVGLALSLSGAITEGSDVAAGTLDLLIVVSGAIQEGSDSVDGALDVEGAIVSEPYVFAPYVSPRRRLVVKKKKEPEPTPVEVTVSTPLELAEPISYALEVDTLSEAGRSVERVLDNLDELRTLVHKEAKRRKRRKRILALITIQ